MIDKDLGYYLCDGIEFQSKVDACIYAQTVNKPVHWFFQTNAYNSHNWLIEPTETLDQLYDKRSKEIREQYDYVILSFSGGADTNNILESFIRQGLHIDEIVTNHTTKASQGTTVLDPAVKKAWNFAAEHQLQTIPRLQYIRDKLPNTKITVIDVSDTILTSMQQYDGAEWVLGRADQVSLGQLFRYNYFNFGELRKQFDKNLKIAMVVGVDKPRTHIDANNNFILTFNDSTTNMTSIDSFNTEYSNIKTELFYWAESTAPLICKQVHTIKNWLLANPDKIPYWKTNKFAIARLFHERWLRSILYTTWNDTWFQADKGVTVWNSEFDAWFRTNPEFSKQYAQWKQGIDYLTKTIPDYIQYDPLHGADRLKPFKQEYVIGKIVSVDQK